MGKDKGGKKERERRVEKGEMRRKTVVGGRLKNGRRKIENHSKGKGETKERKKGRRHENYVERKGRERREERREKKEKRKQEQMKMKNEELK